MNIKVIKAQEAKRCNIYTIFYVFNNPTTLLYTL